VRWEDERYVRIYTRDTPEWTALSWDARSVFWGLLRRCDRAGILRVGKAGLRALAGVIPAPLEVVERAVPELLADGCLLAADGAYIIPNFLRAQEAITTDAQRKRDQRERDRARMMAEGVTGTPSALDKVAALERAGVTIGDAVSLVGVTPSHINAPPVTPGHSVPSLTVPGRAGEEALSATADLPLSGEARFDAADLQGMWNETAGPLGLPRWQAMTSARRTAAAARIHEHPQRSWWVKVFELLAVRRFLLGENDRGWKADPDWFLRPGKAESLLEGKYAGRPETARHGAIDVKRGRVPAESQDALHGPPGEHVF
jgi:hypothetical protein